MMDDILFLDVEGTGLDTANDRIVELCLYPIGGAPTTRRFNPEIPIPAESTAVHGITDADVAGAPKFRQVAASVQQLIEGKVLCGYSVRKYDSLILDAELRRAGQPGLPRDEAGKLAVRELDLYEIWHRHEPRSLVGAAKRFAGVDLGEDAHSADADTTVLPAVLRGMIETFGIADLGIEDLCALSVPDGEVDRDRKFLLNAEGVIVFNFGNSRGTPAIDDPGLLQWMLKKDFSAETKGIAAALLDEAWNS